MNAIRKAAEHKRKAFRPVVSEAGIAALHFLAMFGDRYFDGSYRSTWHAECYGSIVLTATTIRSLEHCGLITLIHDHDGVYLVTLSPAGRKYLEDTK